MCVYSLKFGESAGIVCRRPGVSKRMRNFLEDLAEQVIAESALPIPIDALALAQSLNLRVVKGPIPTAATVPGQELIIYSEEARQRRIHGLVSHEIAEFLIATYGLPDAEVWANYLGAALLVPRFALLRDLDTHGVDLPALMQVHVNASSTLLARRIVELIGGSVALWKDGERRWVYPLRAHVPAWTWHVGEGYVVTIARGFSGLFPEWLAASTGTP